MASLHVEVDSKMSAVDIDHLSRKIFNLVYEEYQVIVSAVGIYAYNCDDPETERILEDLRNRLEKYPNAIQLHGFYLNKEEKTMSFDVVIDFDAEDRMAVYREIKEEVRGAYPEYQVFVAMDEDISD
jgi:divalent metal cation (Fe/Co/Zn/Cd) transporter